MRKQAIEIKDKLEFLLDAYDSLQVLTADNNADSGNVGHVLFVLNEQLRATIKELDTIKTGKPKLEIV